MYKLNHCNEKQYVEFLFACVITTEETTYQVKINLQLRRSMKDDKTKGRLVCISFSLIQYVQPGILQT